MILRMFHELYVSRTPPTPPIQSLIRPFIFIGVLIAIESAIVYLQEFNFNADHPFIYAIRSSSDNENVFIGRFKQ